MGWCPWQRKMIATGGGWKDGELRIWDTDSGTCVTSASTNSQVLETQNVAEICLLCLNIKFKVPNDSSCRSVLYDGLKRRDVSSQVMVFLRTTSLAGPGSFPPLPQCISSQVREPKKLLMRNNGCQ